MKFLPFKPAREYVQKLGLRSQVEWNEYCKSGKKPDNVPVTADRVYKNKGWNGWDDFLGFRKRNVRWLPFEEARETILPIGLKNQADWRTRQIELTSWVFATANSCEKIIEPLISRFVVLKVPEYKFDKFTEIAVTRLRKESVDESLARSIAEKVWSELVSSDIRDVIKVGRLVSNEQEISFMINMMMKR